MGIVWPMMPPESPMATNDRASGSTEPYRGGNALIDSLPEADRSRIIPHLRVFHGEATQCITPLGEDFVELFFPIDAILSITAELRRGDTYEIAVIGRLGAVGAEVALGARSSPRTVLVQVEGRAARIEREAFSACVREVASFAEAMQRHILHRLFFAEQLIACNFAHSGAQRCARWMLVLADEVGREAFGLRREFFAMMMGVDRSSCDDAIDALATVQAIRYENEFVEILDRERVLDCACECYEQQRQHRPVSA